MFLPMLVFALACVTVEMNPIDTCPTSSIDCCSADWHCAEVYDDAWADEYGTLPLDYCLTPGEQTGMCGQCVYDLHCPNGLSCVRDHPDIPGRSVCLAD